MVDILFVVRWAYDGLQWFTESTYWCLVGNGWEWGNGMIITSDYGSFPHSLLSTSKFWAIHNSELYPNVIAGARILLTTHQPNHIQVLASKNQQMFLKVGYPMGPLFIIPFYLKKWLLTTAATPRVSQKKLTNTLDGKTPTPRRGSTAIGPRGANIQRPPLEGPTTPPPRMGDLDDDLLNWETGVPITSGWKNPHWSNK